MPAPDDARIQEYVRELGAAIGQLEDLADCSARGETVDATALRRALDAVIQADFALRAARGDPPSPPIPRSRLRLVAN